MLPLFSGHGIRGVDLRPGRLRLQRAEVLGAKHALCAPQLGQSRPALAPGGAGAEAKAAGPHGQLVAFRAVSIPFGFYFLVLSGCLVSVGIKHDARVWFAHDFERFVCDRPFLVRGSMR